MHRHLHALSISEFPKKISFHLVSQELVNLRNEDINSLGLALGLNYASVRNKQENKLNDMIQDWQSGKDNAVPFTWGHLATALKDIGHTGIARNVAKYC